MSQAPNPSWWSRNWIWAIPVGCLSPILLCGGCGALVLVVGFGAIRSSDTYNEALARATASERVQAVLGTPIKAGYFPTGSFRVSGADGNASLAIPISGPKKSATIYVVATKTAGRWEYSTLEVAPEGTNERIDLKNAPAK